MEGTVLKKNGYPIGYLRSGSQIMGDLIVKLPDKPSLVGNRTAIFGQSGFGKTTLVKDLLWVLLPDVSFGKLVFDLKGEYIDDTLNEEGEHVPGLKHHPQAREKLVLYTQRANMLKSHSLKDNLDFIHKPQFSRENITTGDFISLYPHLTPPQREFLLFYEDSPTIWQTILRRDQYSNWDDSIWAEGELKAWIGSGRDKTVTGSRKIVVESIRNKMSGLSRRPFYSDVSFLPHILEQLKEGKTVVMDLSLYGDLDKIFISTIVCRSLFNNNLANFQAENTSEMVRCLVFFEEAQNLLSPAKVAEGSVFTKMAKEARSMQIGICAITQQPSGIDKDLLSQFANYICLHLEFEEDIQFLTHVAGGFEGLEMDIRRKIPGNAYLVSRARPFAIPLRVFHFNEEFVNSDASRGPAGEMGGTAVKYPQSGLF